MSIDQDRLDVALEKKQDLMLDIKQGFYAPTEGENGDTGGCMYNGVFYYAIKANNKWQFIAMQDANTLEMLNKNNIYQSSIITEENIASYVLANAKNDWAVHHSFTSNFDSNPQINYLQYGTGDVNETNDSAGRFFVVPCACKLKNINFIIVAPQNTTGSDVTYTFDVYVQSATPTSTTFTNVVEPLSFSVTISNGATRGIGNLVINANMKMNTYYVVYLFQTVFPGGLNATKQGKATSYFSSI